MANAIGALFGNSQTRQMIAPVPVAPSVSVDDSAARQQAADTATADAKARGRASTIVGGRRDALAARTGAAAADLLG